MTFGYIVDTGEGGQGPYTVEFFSEDRPEIMGRQWEFNEEDLYPVEAPEMDIDPGGNDYAVGDTVEVVNPNSSSLRRGLQQGDVGEITYVSPRYEEFYVIEVDQARSSYPASDPDIGAMGDPIGNPQTNFPITGPEITLYGGGQEIDELNDLWKNSWFKSAEAVLEGDFYVIVGQEPVWIPEGESWRDSAYEILEQYGEDEVVFGRVTSDNVQVFNMKPPNNQQLDALRAILPPEVTQVTWGLWSKDVYDLPDGNDPTLFPTNPYESESTNDPHEWEGYTETITLYRGLVGRKKNQNGSATFDNLRLQWDQFGIHWTDRYQVARAFAGRDQGIAVIISAEVSLEDIEDDHTRGDNGGVYQMESEYTIRSGSKVNLTSIEIYENGQLVDNFSMNKQVTASSLVKLIPG